MSKDDTVTFLTEGDRHRAAPTYRSGAFGRVKPELHLRQESNTLSGHGLQSPPASLEQDLLLLIAQN